MARTTFDEWLNATQLPSDPVEIARLAWKAARKPDALKAPYVPRGTIRTFTNAEGLVCRTCWKCERTWPLSLAFFPPRDSKNPASKLMSRCRECHSTSTPEKRKEIVARFKAKHPNYAKDRAAAIREAKAG